LSGTVAHHYFSRRARCDNVAASHLLLAHASDAGTVIAKISESLLPIAESAPGAGDAAWRLTAGGGGAAPRGLRPIDGAVRNRELCCDVWTIRSEAAGGNCERFYPMPVLSDWSST